MSLNLTHVLAFAAAFALLAALLLGKRLLPSAWRGPVHPRIDLDPTPESAPC